MGLVTPEWGLIFWTTISFIILFFLLRKWVWKFILDSLNERESTIDNALKSAEEAKAAMAQLKSENEALLQEARNERDNMLKEARDTKNQIIAEAKDKAKVEAERISKQAREAIKNEKNAALTELKNQVAALSIEIAEKIIKEELSSQDKQKALANNLVDDMNLN